MFKINTTELIDFYKADHRSQYPSGTTEIYSNFTARKSRIKGVDKVVWFGLQYLMQRYFIDEINETFFNRKEEEVCEEYQSQMVESLGIPFSVEHIRDLHRLGYLPIEIKSLPEGSIVPLQVPLLTLKNTHPDFFWLTNYVESLISTEIWKPATSATMAHEFRSNFDYYADISGADKGFVDFQGHDFSFRGMSGVNDACVSGAAHLTSFKGTDTLPAIRWIKYYYGSEGFIGGSVPATEHSVMCSGNEYETTKRLLTEVYPTGILSIVADSYDFWSFVNTFLPSIKDIILARNGKLVIRPDSGTPHKILCGDYEGKTEAEQKGLVQCLWDIFGGDVNDKGHKVLDGHIGAIYGDSIDLNEQGLILEGLYSKGFASSNVVLGIGSYTYQYVTRDTFGFVCKATSRVTNGERFSIFKDPKTGGWKKSHKGLLRVNDDYSVIQDCTEKEEGGGLLKTVFKNGTIVVRQTFDSVRGNLA